MVKSSRIGQSNATKHLSLKIYMNIHKFTEEEIKDIIYSYTVLNMNKKEISKKYNVSIKPIDRVLKENDIPSRKGNIKDENYFEEINNQRKAYVLGYLFADGTLQGNYISCSASIQNYEILEIIKSELKSHNKIIVSPNNPNSFSKEGTNNYIFSVASPKYRKDLLNLGFQEDKTHKDFSFPSISKELERHFIRGYFDGNGSVTINFNKTNKGVAGFASPSKRFLVEIQRKINKVTGSKANVYPYKNKNAFEYKIGGANNLEKIYHYFYDDAELFLGRKKAKFDEFMENR